jgi:hypothetical protein
MALALCLSRGASALDFTFEQAGFSEGAVVTGTFSGEDLDSNGQLSSFDGEISGFSMSFSGNSIVSAFSLGFPDFFGLVYDLDGGPLGDGLLLDVEGVAAGGAPEAYAAGPGAFGPFNQCGIGIDCAYVSDGSASDFSQELVDVQLVPEPTTALLTCLGLVVLAARRKK